MPFRNILLSRRLLRLNLLNSSLLAASFSVTLAIASAGAVPFVNTRATASKETDFKMPSEQKKSKANTEILSAKADAIYFNGAVCTMDAARRWCDAVAINNGRLIFVGTNEGARSLQDSQTKLIDLKGKMILPGFHDTHVHLAEGGVELGQLSLEGATSVSEVQKRLKEYVEKNPEKDWILGGNWALTLFPEANPKKEILDEIVRDKPVFLISNDGHSAWANSKAMQLSGIGAKTADPERGRIERNSAGEPTGAFREAAIDLIRAKAPKVSAEEMLAGTINAIKYANSFGITAVTEANAGEDTLTAYQKLEQSGKLNLKVRTALETDPKAGDSQVQAAQAVRSKYDGQRLKVAAVKFFADGVMETHTASLLSPYTDKQELTGISNWSDEKFARLATLFDRAGFQIHVHAIGDKAVRQALNSLETSLKENGNLGHRHHIAHLQLVAPSDIPRFRKLGVSATFQPLWAYRDAFVNELTVPVIGEERTNRMYAINSFLRQGTVLSAGSDWTVSSLNPLDAIEVAVTRKGLSEQPEENKDLPLNLDERVNLLDILAAYTSGGAYVDHSDDQTGSLEVGKCADFIILEKNLFDLPASEIHKVRVLQTLIDGKVVFDRENALPPTGERQK